MASAVEPGSLTCAAVAHIGVDVPPFVPIAEKQRVAPLRFGRDDDFWKRWDTPTWELVWKLFRSL
jgi:hypothetical protein